MSSIISILIMIFLGLAIFLSISVTIATYIGDHNKEKAEKMNKVATRIYTKIGIMKSHYKKAA